MNRSNYIQAFHVGFSLQFVKRRASSGDFLKEIGFLSLLDSLLRKILLIFVVERFNERHSLIFALVQDSMLVNYDLYQTSAYEVVTKVPNKNKRY